MVVAAAHAGVCEPPESGSSNTSRLTREQVVDRILALNPTASTEYLSGFPETSLTVYLEHLVVTSGPRGRHAIWVRPGDSPAIMGRESRI